jgi:hypothetical protein
MCVSPSFRSHAVNAGRFRITGCGVKCSGRQLSDRKRFVVIVRFRTTWDAHPASHSSKLFGVDRFGQQKCNTHSNHKESDHNV